MLTPLLEQLIQEGKAVYGVFNAAYDSARLDIPDNSYIVVIGAQVYPFFDVASDADYLDASKLFARSIHTMRLGSDKSNLYFTFRNNPYLTYDNATGILYATPGEPIKFDCYGVFTKQMFVEFTTMKWDRAAAVTSAVQPARSENRPPEIGYGTVSNGGLTCVQKLNTNDAATPHQYYPLGSVSNVPAGQRALFQFIIPPSVPTKLNIRTPLTVANDLFSFPIVNVYYVQINGNPGSTVKAAI